MFLHKSHWPRSLKLPFKPVGFWLRILGDIHIRKSTPRIDESTYFLPNWSFKGMHGLAVKSAENQHQINFFFE
jgi:hypothetical protein